jgi:hypothetical protein
MVHALDEIHRTLVRGGILIDLRPLADRWPVDVTSGREHHEVGRLSDLPAGLADDEAANRAVEESAARGWFAREREKTFPFFYYWDTPTEMCEYVTKEWEKFVELEEDVMKATKSAWEIANADSRVGVRMKMLMTRWRRQ